MSELRPRHSSRSLSPPGAKCDHQRQRPSPNSYRHRSSRDHTKSRSRSPSRSDRHDRHSRHHRDHRHHHDHHRRHGRDEREPNRDRDRDRNPDRTESAKVVLPFEARELHKRDLTQFQPLFAMYLDIQKGLLLEDLGEEEVKGRWKSFVRKWNRGELAEGWYDASTFEKARRHAQESVTSGPNPSATERRILNTGSARRDQSHWAEEVDSERRYEEVDDEDDDDYGPKLSNDALEPIRSASHRTRPQASGPTIPNLQDLDLRRESAIAEASAARQESRDRYRAEARSHRSKQRHLEDEVAPRAEPGTHERRMEKRRETAAANRSFAEARRGGSPVEAAPDEELMGAGENDLDALRKAREKEKRKKNERELRREEILRARAAEREERVQKYRQKEEETIGWLKALAKQRYG